jgi:hypothetical protein
MLASPLLSFSNPKLMSLTDQGQNEVAEMAQEGIYNQRLIQD